jgi:hypothetical protein
VRSVIAITLCLIAGTAIACKVPVFRFALERWETDDYTLLYRDLTDAPQLGQQNVVARHDPDLLQKFAAFYPEAVGKDEPFWTGEDSSELMDSPLRQQLLEKITTGASTVWVLIEGPDQEQNDAAQLKLTTLLAEAASTLEIPEGVVRPEQLDTGEVNLADIDVKNVLRSPIPLKIDFQSLRLKFGDQREAAFRQMLIGLSPNPAINDSQEPLLVPVFGRGRMLEALPASMLNQQTATMASQYLCGECSCEVKDENPGADILLTANWEEILEDSYTIIDQTLPPLAGAGEFLSEPPAPAPMLKQESSEPSNLPRNLFILGVCAALFLSIASTRILRPKA